MDCDIVVVDHSWFLGAGESERAAELEAFIRSRRRPKVVLLDHSDAPFQIWQPWFPRFDRIFRAHLNRYEFKTSNMVPSGFGFTKRVISSLRPEVPWSKRAPVVLNTFRIPHPVRSKGLAILEKILGPELALQTWNDNFSPPSDPEARFLYDISGRRHNPAYFAAMGAVQGAATFGGAEFKAAPAWVRAGAKLFDVGAAQRLWPTIHRRVRFAAHRLWRPKIAVRQFDSWRFWEALGSGTVAFNIDLDLYGALYPVQPINGRHYVGLDLSSERTARSGLEAMSGRLGDIADAGRLWALEHYSPVAMAIQFLSELA
jgi:hypothetical protein